MNTRQSLFVSEYLKSLNATDAAIKAGYSKKTAYSIGERLLKNVEVAKKIMEQREKIEKNAELTVTDIVREIREIALNAKSETNRLRAYDMLMKHLGGYSDLKLNINSLPDSDLDRVIDILIARSTYDE
ncbi:MAG: terminase small subunit [Bacteroidales bacterium]|nr:terminase small subunit [Bacteroidales bacterium]